MLAVINKFMIDFYPCFYVFSIMSKIVFKLFYYFLEQSLRSDGFRVSWSPTFSVLILPCCRQLTSESTHTSLRSSSLLFPSPHPPLCSLFLQNVLSSSLLMVKALSCTPSHVRTCHWRTLHKDKFSSFLFKHKCLQQTLKPSEASPKKEGTPSPPAVLTNFKAGSLFISIS